LHSLSRLTQFQKIKREEWPSIKDRHDPRIAGRDMDSFLARAYSLSIVNALSIWKRREVYKQVKAFLESPRAKKGAQPVVSLS
jgi:hypothetical protein